MSIKGLLKRSGRRLGVDLMAWPDSSAQYACHSALVSGSPEVVLDVGANTGQFAVQCREFGYRGAIVSFEPGQQAYRDLEKAAQADPLWTAVPLALSDVVGTAELTLTSNAGMSSSLHTMLPSHVQAAPEIEIIGTETVQVSTVDAYLSQEPFTRVALKLDTQGSEEQVLAGATASLPRIQAIQLECNLVHLYEGDWLWADITSWMSAHGYRLAGVAPVFRSESTHLQQQIDAVFVREE